MQRVQASIGLAALGELEAIAWVGCDIHLQSKYARTESQLREVLRCSCEYGTPAGRFMKRKNRGATDKKVKSHTPVALRCATASLSRGDVCRATEARSLGQSA